MAGKTSESGEGREEEGREAAQDGAETAIRQGREASAALRRQSADRERLRRRAGAGLHRRHARLEKRSRPPPRRAIVRAVPGVRKAVKWNSPFYGVEDEVWFLSFHCFTQYVKVAFFRGTSLRPVPPGESKHKDVRYLDIHEDDFDEAQFVAWVKQASKLPGERL